MGFQQGLSGLSASSKALDTVGNNIANSGTVGFKSGSAQFADVFAASLSGAGSSPVGIGAKVAAIVQQFSQGNISVTNNPLDTAINGGGFFQMDDGNGGTVYSRNGQFQLDKNGFIVSAQGLQLKGIAAVSGVIAAGSPPVPLRLFDPTQSLSGTPQMTGGSTSGTGVQANVNLDSRLGVPATAVFDFGDPTSYNQSTATTIYDSLGNPHTYSMYFVKTAAINTWDIYATLTNPAGAVPAFSNLSAPTAAATAAVTAATTETAAADASIAAATAAEAAAVAAALVSPADAAFVLAAVPLAPASMNAAAVTAAGLPGATAASVLAAVTGTGPSAVAAAVPLLPAAVNAAATAAAGLPGATTASVLAAVTAAGAMPTSIGSMTFSTSGALTSPVFAASLTDAQLGYTGAVTTPQSFPIDFSGSTQYGAQFAVNAMVQDGYTSGTLAGFNIGKDGVVLGRYTNGQTKPVGQVILANFRNPQGLQPLGDNRWAQSPTSGDAILGVPGSSGQYGVLQASGLEDSNVDLTAELVNMITQQRAYQANAQTIKTVDSILQTLVNLR